MSFATIGVWILKGERHGRGKGSRTDGFLALELI